VTSHRAPSLCCIGARAASRCDVIGAWREPFKCEHRSPPSAEKLTNFQPVNRRLLIELIYSTANLGFGADWRPLSDEASRICSVRVCDVLRGHVVRVAILAPYVRCGGRAECERVRILGPATPGPGPRSGSGSTCCICGVLGSRRRCVARRCALCARGVLGSTPRAAPPRALPWRPRLGIKLMRSDTVPLCLSSYTPLCTNTCHEDNGFALKNYICLYTSSYI
jgi:hypothetical protein